MRKLFVSFLLLTVLFLPNRPIQAAGGISLFTPYTGISVTPGKTVNYSFEVINNASSVQQVSFSLINVPKEWKYDMTAGGFAIDQLAIKPNESQPFNLEMDVPLKVQKGDYAFVLQAESKSGLKTVLPVHINVSEKGTFKTELTSDQANMEGDASSSFTYNVTLKNKTSEQQRYALKSGASRGWGVQFKVDGKTVTSVSIDSNAAKDIQVDVTPPEKVDAGTYQIPIKATTSATSSDLNLEAVITGRYGVELTTQTGKLSETITAGREKKLKFVVNNNGTASLNNIKVNATAPPNWDVTFDQNTIKTLQPGKSETVIATLKASDKAIAGDYVVNLEASTPEASSKQQYRVTVETSTLWGWTGILIIIVVVGAIFYLMRTYGRR